MAFRKVDGLQSGTILGLRMNPLGAGLNPKWSDWKSRNFLVQTPDKSATNQMKDPA
jgi:hypothetical protein